MLHRPLTTPRSRSLAALAALTLLIAAPPAANAFQPAQPTQPQSPSRSHGAEGPVLSIDFNGGSVAEYVGALREIAAASGDPAVNVAVSKRAAAVELPPIELRSVTLYTALRAATYAAELPQISQLEVSAMPSSDGSAGPAVAAFALTVTDPPPFPTGMVPPGHFPAQGASLRVISLRDLVGTGAGGGGVPIGTVLTAVQTALDLSNEDGAHPATLKYHQDSLLLIVRGAAGQLQAVEQVIAELTNSIQRASSQDLQFRKRQLDLELEQRRAESRMALAKLKRDSARDREEQLEMLFKEGKVSSLELQEAKIAASEAYIEERAAQDEYHHVQQQLQLLQREAATTPAPAPAKKQPTDDSRER